MNNYEYCAQWAAQTGNTNARVLDYGCGCGELVALLVRRGIDAWGCDVFYDGGDFSNLRPDAAPRIVRMVGDRIPFEDSSFDILVSNQVIEHLPDLRVAVGEMARVLKPGGRCLHVFPHRAVLREPHTRIPFLHWLPKGAAWRLPYAVLMRPRSRPLVQSARHRIAWVDAWTHFRSLREIHATFEAYFDVEYGEDHWFVTRFGSRGLPASVRRRIARAAAGSVLMLRRHAQ